MNVFAKFDEIPSMTLQDIKETKRCGHTFVRLDGQTDNVKTVYPPTDTVCGGYKNFCSKVILAIETLSVDRFLELLQILYYKEQIKIKMLTRTYFSARPKAKNYSPKIGYQTSDFRH